MKKLILLFAFVALVVQSFFAQPSSFSWDRFYMGNVTMTNNSPVNGIISNTTQATVSSAYYLVQWDSYYNKWSNTNTPYNSEFTLTWGGGSNNGHDGILTIATTINKYYTLQINGLAYSNRTAVLMETDNAPQSFDANASTAVSTPTYVYAGQTATIYINLAGSKSPQERVFVRYSIDNWGTSKVVEATGTGTTWSNASATIPSGDNTLGSTIKYYAYSTTVAATNSSSHDLITLKLANNSGPNYSYTVIAPTAATDYFQSQGTGNWSNTATWQSSSNGTSNWIPSTLVPGVSSTGVTILSGNTVTLDQSTTSVSSLTINSGASLTINAGKQLTVNTTLTNNGTLNLLSTSADGTATILTPASIGGSGTTNVQQYLTAGRNWYISSPVSGATSNIFNALNSGSEKLYYYNEPTGTSNPWPQITDNGTSLNIAQGYVANVDATQLAATNGITFTGGSLNNGAKSISLTFSSTQNKAGYNMIGNPYPSYLNAMTAINSNSTLTEKTIWYRTISTGSTPTYYFETVNTTSGIGTNNAGTGTVTGYIPPMQAFWVKTTGGTTLGFDNSMRSHSGMVSTGAGSVPTTPLKAPASKTNVSQLLRLDVSNGSSNDETVVYFNANASDGFDSYDSEKMSNNNAAIPEIYTLAGTEQLAINGLNSIATNPVLPLGFTTGTSSTFTIKASEVSNFDANTKIVLKDNLLNTEQDLTDGTAYSFSSDVASTTSRFSLVFKSVGVTTGLQAAFGDPSTLIYKNANNQIEVNCNCSLSDNATVSVYNTLGQKLESKQMTSATTVIGRTFTSGVYVVTVNNGEKITTRKVILN